MLIISNFLKHIINSSHALSDGYFSIRMGMGPGKIVRMTHDEFRNWLLDKCLFTEKETKHAIRRIQAKSQAEP